MKEKQPRRGVGLIGAAEGAPLTQGRDASLPLDFEGDNLAEPPEPGDPVRGAPTEPVIHTPTTTEIEPRPVATGECTVEDLAGTPLCDAEE